MVDPEGSACEIEATAYAGDRSFVSAAKRAAERYQYEPAHADGKPIYSGAATRITFRLSEGQVGARASIYQEIRQIFVAGRKRSDNGTAR